MKQITLRTLVRAEYGRGLLWQHTFATIDENEERTSLGMETITLTHRYPLCYEVESFEEDGSVCSRYLKTLKQAEAALKGGRAS